MKTLNKIIAYASLILMAIAVPMMSYVILGLAVSPEGKPGAFDGLAWTATGLMAIALALLLWSQRMRSGTR